MEESDDFKVLLKQVWGVKTSGNQDVVEGEQLTRHLPRGGKVERIKLVSKVIAKIDRILGVAFERVRRNDDPLQVGRELKSGGAGTKAVGKTGQNLQRELLRDEIVLPPQDQVELLQESQRKHDTDENGIDGGGRWNGLIFHCLFLKMVFLAVWYFD